MGRPRWGSAKRCGRKASAQHWPRRGHTRQEQRGDARGLPLLGRKLGRQRSCGWELSASAVQCGHQGRSEGREGTKLEDSARRHRPARPASLRAPAAPLLLNLITTFWSLEEAWGQGEPGWVPALASLARSTRCTSPLSPATMAQLTRGSRARWRRRETPGTGGAQGTSLSFPPPPEHREREPRVPRRSAAQRWP